MDQYKRSSEIRSSLILFQPLIGIHDPFDQQAKPLELSKVHVLHCLVEAAVDPLAIAHLVDGEVLIKGLAVSKPCHRVADALSECYRETSSAIIGQATLLTERLLSVYIFT